MYATVNGTRIHYVVEGSGLPLVIPSLAGTPIYECTFSQRLREHVQLIFVELRSGRSDVGDVGELTLERIVDDLDGVRQHLGHERIAVLGQSAHGLLALAYAERYPAQISHVVVVASPPSTRPSKVLDTLHAAYWDTLASPERKQLLAQQEATVAEHVAHFTPTEAVIARYAAGGPRTWYDAAYDCTPLWAGHDSISPELLERFFGPDGQFATFDPERSLSRVTCPVFIAAGVFDFLCPPILWAGFKEKLPNHTFHTFERSGHLPHFEEQSSFDSVLTTWLQSTGMR